MFPEKVPNGIYFSQTLPALVERDDLERIAKDARGVSRAAFEAIVMGEGFSPSGKSTGSRADAQKKLAGAFLEAKMLLLSSLASAVCKSLGNNGKVADGALQFLVVEARQLAARGRYAEKAGGESQARALETAEGMVDRLAKAAVENANLRAMFCIAFGLKGVDGLPNAKLEKIKMGAFQACADRAGEFVQKNLWNASCKVGWGYEREFNLLAELLTSPVEIAEKDFPAIIRALDVLGEYGVLLSMPGRGAIRFQPKYSLAWIEAQYAAKNEANLAKFCRNCEMFYLNDSNCGQAAGLYGAARNYLSLLAASGGGP